MQGIFNDDAFSKMKRGARLVNVARGGVVDDASLVRALDAGIVAQVQPSAAPCGCFSCHATACLPVCGLALEQTPSLLCFTAAPWRINFFQLQALLVIMLAALDKDRVRT